MFVGFLAGVAFYCATAFPFAILAHTTGSVWSLIFFVYGVVCGFAGTLLGDR